jgi:hypothetical protein
MFPLIHTVLLLGLLYCLILCSCFCRKVYVFSFTFIITWNVRGVGGVLFSLLVHMGWAFGRISGGLGDIF